MAEMSMSRAIDVLEDLYREETVKLECVVHALAFHLGDNMRKVYTTQREQCEARLGALGMAVDALKRSPVRW